MTSPMSHTLTSHSAMHTLVVDARFCPEVSERVLRVTRHRGFQVWAMNMVLADAADRVNIELTVCSERPVEQLSAQLGKLIDVASVCLRAVQSDSNGMLAAPHPMIRA